VDNRGFANVTRVVREDGSAHMDGNTLVVEKASSVMLLTRIEYFPEFSADNQILKSLSFRRGI
jgi:alpha-L-fucosidase 2